MGLRVGWWPVGWGDCDGRREGILRSLRALREGWDVLERKVWDLYLDIKTCRQRLRDKKMGQSQR